MGGWHVSLRLFIAFYCVVIAGLFLCKISLQNNTLHVVDKTPLVNPFVVTSAEMKQKKLWNSKLYDKVVVWILDDWQIEKDLQKMTTQEGTKAIMMRMKLMGSHVSSLFVGTPSSSFEMGNQNHNLEEDSIFYQLSQSSYRSIGFLNMNWPKLMRSLLTVNRQLNPENSNFEDFIETIKQQNFDFLIAHDPSEYSNTKLASGQNFSLLLEEVVSSLTATTILFITSAKTQLASTQCLSPLQCEGFLFAFSKSEFTNQSKLLQDIQLEYLVETASAPAPANLADIQPPSSNVISPTSISPTISALMGLPFAYSNSGHLIPDFYPSRLSEIQLISRMLQDSFNNLMQIYSFATTLQKRFSLFSQSSYLEFSEAVNYIRTHLPKDHFDKTTLTKLLSRIMLAQENIRNQLDQSMLPFNLANVKIAFLLILLALIVFICLATTKPDKITANNNESVRSSSLPTESSLPFPVQNEQRNQSVHQSSKIPDILFSILIALSLGLYAWKKILDESNLRYSSQITEKRCGFLILVFSLIKFCQSKKVQLQWKLFIPLLMILATQCFLPETVQPFYLTIYPISFAIFATTFLFPIHQLRSIQLPQIMALISTIINIIYISLIFQLKHALSPTIDTLIEILVAGTNSISMLTIYFTKKERISSEFSINSIFLIISLIFLFAPNKEIQLISLQLVTTNFIVFALISICKAADNLVIFFWIVFSYEISLEKVYPVSQISHFVIPFLSVFSMVAIQHSSKQLTSMLNFTSRVLLIQAVRSIIFIIQFVNAASKNLEQATFARDIDFFICTLSAVSAASLLINLQSKLSNKLKNPMKKISTSFYSNSRAIGSTRTFSSYQILQDHSNPQEIQLQPSQENA